MTLVHGHDAKRQLDAVAFLVFRLARHAGAVLGAVWCKIFTTEVAVGFHTLISLVSVSGVP